MRQTAVVSRGGTLPDQPPMLRRPQRRQPTGMPTQLPSLLRPFLHLRYNIHASHLQWQGEVESHRVPPCQAGKRVRVVKRGGCKSREEKGSLEARKHAQAKGTQ